MISKFGPLDGFPHPGEIMIIVKKVKEICSLCGGSGRCPRCQSENPNQPKKENRG